MERGLEGSSGSAAAIDSSNIGFRLLKKHGWKEGTGLGISEQGRLEPVEAHLKNNKRGLGADKVKKKALKPLDTKTTTIPDGKSEQKIYQKRLQLGFGAVVGRRGLVTHSGHTNRSNYCEQGISNLPNPLLGSHVVDSVPSIRWHDVRLWVFVTWSGWLLGEVWLPPRGSPPTLIAITASFSSNPSSH